MGLMDSIRNRIIDFLQIDSLFADKEAKNRLYSMALNADYYFGNHTPQFKIRMGGMDDNIYLNFVKLIVNRAVSMLLGSGIKIDISEDDESENQEWLESLLELNKKDILLQKVAKNGALYGTCFLKIQPEGIISETGESFPRLILLNPMHVEIVTDPEDIENIIKYIIRFNYVNPATGKEVARKEEIAKDYGEAGFQYSWLISDYISDNSNGDWRLLNDPIKWDFEFAPIIHWQNLPNGDAPYGYSDIDENMIQLQNKINFNASNISKIIRYHGHPKTWGKGSVLSNKVQWGADEIVMLQGENASLQNLEMQSDLSSSLSFLKILRQTIFDLSQTVDLDSIQDKLGSLTNFGLRVLYLDSESKLGVKQEIWGDALTDLVKRLMVIGGKTLTSDVQITFPDVLPSNEKEQMESDKFELDYKLVSSQTISSRRGYNYEDEQEKITDEQITGDNVGAAILRAFQSGQ